MKDCKKCYYYNCNDTKKNLRCKNCIISDYGCRVCYCATIGYNADLCKYYTEKKKDEVK